MPKTRAKAGTDAEPPGGGAGHATGLWVLGVGGLVAAYLFFTNSDPKTFSEYVLINTGFCLWLPLLTVLLILKQEPSQFGLTRGDRRLGLKWTLIAWAVMVLPLAYVAHRHDFQQQYLFSRLSGYLPGVGAPYAEGRVHLKALLYYELAYGGFYMFCWEFFFRGFLLFGLQKTRLGTWGAVIVQALVFTLLHWSPQPGAAKPGLEVAGALPGGLILGVLALRTRSFLYGYLAHWAISLTLDLFMLAPFIFRGIG